MPTDWKVMSDIGSGVYEIRIRSQAEHWVLYIAKYEEAVYVIHAFEKRTARTAKTESALARQRLSELRRQRRDLAKKETR